MNGLRRRGIPAASGAIAATLAIIGSTQAGFAPRGGASLSVGNSTATEGNSGTVTARFRVELSGPRSVPVSVDYATAPGSATSPADFTAASGTLTFSPGQTLKRVDIAVKGDIVDEPLETYTVGLSNPQGAPITDGSGLGRILDDDLIRNHGAEAGGSGGDIDLVNWAETGATTAVAYGDPEFPTVPLGNSIGGGVNFFAGGSGTQRSTATQTVNLPVATHDEIDGGAVSAELTGYLGGYNVQNDNASVTATFLNASGAAVGAVTIGPVTAADRGGTTTLLFRSADAAVPPGTRKVRVRQVFTRFSGSYNDGYSDNITLTLDGV
jgi:hypothetical protein